MGGFHGQKIHAAEADHIYYCKLNHNQIELSTTPEGTVFAWIYLTEAEKNSVGRSNFDYDKSTDTLIIKKLKAEKVIMYSSNLLIEESSEISQIEAKDVTLLNIKQGQHLICTGLSSIDLAEGIKNTGNKYQRLDTVDNLEIKLEQTEYAYTGRAICPKVTVKQDNVTLVQNKDYSVQYAKNINAGNAEVKILGMGDRSGTKTVNFRITPVQFSDLGATIKLSSSSFTYTGKPCQPAVEIQTNKVVFQKSDYSICYEANVSAGDKAKVTCKGNDKNITGSISTTFKITPKSISGAAVKFSPGSFTYSGKALTPNVTVTLPGYSITSKDYSVAYTNNINAGKAVVTVAGRGNYSEEKTADFTIVQADLSKASIELENKTYYYNGKSIEPKCNVKLNGSKVDSSQYKVSYKNNKNKGTAQIIVKGSNNCKNSCSKDFEIKAQPSTLKFKSTSPSRMYYTATGKAMEAELGINKSAVIYTSSKPDVLSVNKNSGVLKVMNQTKGLGSTVTITATQKESGNYAATKLTKNIKIVPNKVKITSVESTASGSLSVKWEKSSNATGYHIYYSLSDSNFATAPVNIKSKNTLTTKIKGLAVGRKYYVKVVPYFKDQNYETDRSQIVTCTVKK